MAKTVKHSVKKDLPSRLPAGRQGRQGKKPAKLTKLVAKKAVKSPKNLPAARHGASSKKASVPPPPPPSKEKMQVIEEYQVKPGDTGSPEVQVALLTKRIEKLALHLKSNPSDNHSRRGLLGIVSKRRRLLNYLEKKDKNRYREIIKKIDLSK